MSQNGDRWLQGVVSVVASACLLTAGSSIILVNRLEERVKVNEDDRKSRSKMAEDVARLTERLEGVKSEMVHSNRLSIQLETKLDQLNRNIEARRRESER